MILAVRAHETVDVGWNDMYMKSHEGREAEKCLRGKRKKCYIHTAAKGNIATVHAITADSTDGFLSLMNQHIYRKLSLTVGTAEHIRLLRTL